MVIFMYHAENVEFKFSRLRRHLNCRETPSPIPEIFLCDLLTPHGFSRRNFVRGVICTLKSASLTLVHRKGGGGGRGGRTPY